VVSYTLLNALLVKLIVIHFEKGEVHHQMRDCGSHPCLCGASEAEERHLLKNYPSWDFTFRLFAPTSCVYRPPSEVMYRVPKLSIDS